MMKHHDKHDRIGNSGTSRYLDSQPVCPSADSTAYEELSSLSNRVVPEHLRDSAGFALATQVGANGSQNIIVPQVRDNVSAGERARILEELTHGLQGMIDSGKVRTST